MLARLIRILGRRGITKQPLPEARLSDDIEKIATATLAADVLRRTNYLKQEVALYSHKQP